ncbi:MAG: tetratricopeptide repeat protein [Planctomycetaceae bacterium]
MLFLFAQNEFDGVDPEIYARQYAPFLIIEWFFGTALGLIVTAFTIWMLIECYRKDPDWGTWMWLILAFPGIGPGVYFFVRWLPGNNYRAPASLRQWTKGSELTRLEAAAQRIGNPYHHIQLGDALRDVGKLDQAGPSYAAALAKEPANLQALWGAALVDIHQKSFESARERLARVLEIDPQYKFGDVSLAYGRTLAQLGRVDDSVTHMEKHVRRWRHPEGLYLLAMLYQDKGRIPEARAQLDALLVDIATSPRAIARRQTMWKSKAKAMLKKLPK